MAYVRYVPDGVFAASIVNPRFHHQTFPAGTLDGPGILLGNCSYFFYVTLELPEQYQPLRTLFRSIGLRIFLVDTHTGRLHGELQCLNGARMTANRVFDYRSSIRSRRMDTDENLMTLRLDLCRDAGITWNERQIVNGEYRLEFLFNMGRDLDHLVAITDMTVTIVPASFSIALLNTSENYQAQTILSRMYQRQQQERELEDRRRD